MNKEKAVAVVGIGCRFPGANSPEEFWRVLVNNENHVKEIPPERWNVDGYYSNDKAAPGKTYAKHAGLIDDVLMWDNKVFGINQMEAEIMDPQHKLALEVSFRALEDGGIPMKSIKGSNAAVYMGTMTNDYSGLCGGDENFINNYSPTGLANSVLANRLSYYYDIHGPSLTLDTACSSGMMCVHLGSKSILSGESNVAICGGVGCILSPTQFISLSKARMASEKGQCHTYTENADGYARSEGCGVVILKNLDMAEKDGDRIYGIVTTAVNSDGKAASPMTAPSSDMQAKLIRDTLAQAHLQAQLIQFVEMHGTGTPVGDPIEVSSVGGVYGSQRKTLKQDPVPVGSVKTNMGHLEAAAGIAGLMKVLLMMKYETMAPSVIFGKLKESLDLTGNHVTVLRDKKVWNPIDVNGDKIRLASVNSFGFGGTNAHGIVQSGCSEVKGKTNKRVNESKSLQFVLFTGADSKSTKASMSDTLAYIEANDDITLDDLAYTSCVRRSLFKHRIALSATNLQELQIKLQSTIKQESDFGRRVTGKEKNHVVFVFCGMGTHWSNMGMHLYEQETVYRQTIDKIHNLFSTYGEFDLKQCIAGTYDLSDPKYGQPSIFACQVALFELWQSKGVAPDVIVGHSVGEVAAAYASGQLSLECAAFVIYHRGRIVSKAKDGTMMAVGKLPIKEIENYVKPYESKLGIAAYNSYQSCTLSGAIEEMNKLQSKLESLESKPFVRRLAVKVAYHSACMDPILAELVEALQAMTLVSGQKRRSPRHVSTVTGKEVIGEQLRSPDYWKQNVRHSVRFSDALSLALTSDKMNAVVEIGPKPALKTNIKEMASSMKYEHIPSLSENKDVTFFQSLGRAYELEIVSPPTGTGRFIAAPRYIFDKQYLYKEPEEATAFRKGEGSGPKGGHPFVNKNVGDDDSSTNFQCVVSPQTTNFVYEHLVSDTIIVPGATYVEIGMASLSLLKEARLGIDEEVIISARVNFNQVCYLKDPDSKAVLKVVCHPDENNGDQFNFDVTSGETLHASGRVSIGHEKKCNSRALDLNRLGKHHTDVIKDTILYDTLQKYKFVYGPSLRGVKQITTDYKDAIVKLEIPESADLMNTVIHPAVLDSLLQSGVIFPAKTSTSVEGQVMPYGIEEVNVYGKLRKHMVVHMELMQVSPWKLNATICNTDGMVLAECKGITYGVVGIHPNFDIEQFCFLSSWKEVEQGQITSEPQSKNGKLLIICDDQCTFPMANLQMPSEKVKLTTKMINEILDDEQRLEILLPKDFRNFEAVLFLVGLHRKSKPVHTYTGDQMNDFVLSTNMTLIQLIKIANRLDSFPLIYVITRGVFSLLHKQMMTPDHTLTTLIGSTTTAMCRTVIKELDSLHLCTIDTKTVNKQDLALIGKIISNAFNHYEVSISDGKVRYGTMVPAASGNRSQKRRQMKAQLKNENVRLTRRESVWQGLYIEPIHYEKTDRKDAIEAHLEIVHIDPKCVFGQDNSQRPKSVNQYDSIVKTTDGQKYHICQNHSLSSTLDVSQSHAMPWEAFPCKYPSLSFWLLTWNTLKRIEKHESFKFISGEISPLWNHVVHALADIMGLTIAKECDICENVVLITNQLSDDTIDLVDCKTKLFVISETHIMVKPENELELYHVAIAAPLISPHKITKLLQKFQSWLAEGDHSKIAKTLKKFDGEVTKCSKVVKMSDFNSTALPSASKPLFLSVEQIDKAVSVLASRPQQIIKRDSGYIVIGGRKGLGWETIKHLAELGAKHIGVISRSPPREEMLVDGFLLEEQHNCRIIDLQADTSNMQQLGEALQQFQDTFDVNISGVFYGAAVTSDSIIPTMTKEKFKQVLTPKVAGVWNLYTLTQNMNLDVFIMYSSITSMYGNPGQANYGAGNGFKDAMACLMRSKHGVGQSICFGALDIGIVADQPSARKKLISMGLNPMKVPEIMACLDHALLANLPVVGYSKFMWRTWHRTSAFRQSIPKQYGALMKRYCHYMKKQKGPARGLHLVGNNVSAYVIMVIKAVALLSDEDITMDATLVDLGVDSQDMQQIYSVLREDIGFKESDLNIMEVGGMALQEFIDVISKVRAAQNDNTKVLTIEDADNDKIESITSMETNVAEVSASSETQQVNNDVKSENSNVETVQKLEPLKSKTPAITQHSGPSQSKPQDTVKSTTCLIL